MNWRVLMKIIIGTSLCVLLDMIIKLLINMYFYDCNVNLIGEVVTFSPVLNKSISWFASISRITIGAIPHLFLRIVIFILSLNVTRNIMKKHTISRLVFFALIFWLAGCFCSLIDQVFFSTSLDYIRIRGFFTFDLKDVYISCTEVIVIILAFNFLRRKENRDTLTKMSNIDFVKKIVSYLKFTNNMRKVELKKYPNFHKK
jgi:signal peptidase II